MNQILRHLLVAAIGVTSLGATAQTSTMAPSPPSSTATPSSTVSANVKAEADYRAAVAACDAQTGAAKAACLSDAEKARDRAMQATPDGVTSGSQIGNAGGAPGSPGGTGRGHMQR